MIRRLVSVSCLAVAHVGVNVEAQPAVDGLFGNVEGPASDAASQYRRPIEDPPHPDGSALRTRLVRVDLEALAAARQTLLSSGGNPRTLNLFDDTVFQVVFEKSVPTASGYALQGRLLGVEGGATTLVVRGRIVSGTVTTPLARYTITPAGDGMHLVSEIDWTVAPGERPIPPEDAPGEEFEEPSDSSPEPSAIRGPIDEPLARPGASQAHGTSPLPAVNSNPWQPQGPGAAGRAGGLLDGQVDNVEPNNAVIGAIHTVLAHPTDADILYIGATNGGVWKTTNATATNPDWTPLTDDLGALSIGAMAFDPNDPETILVGIGRYSSFGLRGGDRNGLFLTTDGGNGWQRLDDPLLVDMNVSGVSIDGDRLVVAGSPFTVRAGYRGVLRSEDGGQTWTAVSESDGLPPEPGVFDMVDDPTNADRFYAAVGGTGIFRSDDGGATWLHISESDDAIQAVMTDPANNNGEMAVSHDGRLYLAAMIGGQAQYIGYTDDQGETWTEMDLPQTPESDGDIEGLNPRFKAAAQGYIHFSIRVDPEDANIVYVGGDRQDEPFPNFIGARDYTGRLFRGNASVDPTGDVPSPQWDHLTHSAFISPIPGGGTASRSAPHADSREMVFDAAGDLVQVDDGGIYRRTSPRDNTGDWFSVNGNLQVTEMHDVAYDTLANVIVSGNQDVGNSQQTAGASLFWDALSGADGGDVVIDAREAEGRSIRYLSNQYLRRFAAHVYNADNVRVRSYVPGLLVDGSIPLQFWEPRLQFVQRFELNAVNPNRAVLGASALYESHDQLETLEEALLLDFELDPRDRVQATAYGCADDPDLLYVAHGALQGPRIDVRASGRSANGFVQTGFEGGGPRDILINADACETVYVIDPQSVWASSDTGETWDDITGNLIDVPVRYRDLRKLEFIPAGEIFANAAIAVAGRGGVQVMDVTKPAEWYDLGSGLPDAPVFDLDYDDDDRLLVAGTLGRGAWLILSAAPVVQLGIANQDLEVDDESTLDISRLFYSTAESLSYSVSSSDASVVGVALTGTELAISARKAGAATITVVATDDAGLMGSYTFTVTVGTVVSLAAGIEAVPEGASVSLTINLNRSSTTAIEVDYSIVPGDGSGTAPADANDHNGTDGTLSFAAGETRQTIDLRINDDDEIEPVREAFTVRLAAPAQGDTWGLGLNPAGTVRIKEGVCDRTPEVRDALSPHGDCTEISESDILSVRFLTLEKIDSFKSRDLFDLAGLSRLEITDGAFTSIPERLFDGLVNLVALELARNALETLPEELFDGQSRLKTLNLKENQLTGLPEAVFQGLPALLRLDLTGNALAELPATVFHGLSGLKVLFLGGNRLAELPDGVFDPLNELNILGLGGNQLTSLPGGVFDSLTEMNALDLQENQLTSLPDDAFDGPGNLGLLQLDGNQLTHLPEGLFNGLQVLASLHLDGNQLNVLPARVFEGVESLKLLHLHDNPGTPFQLTMHPVRTDSDALNDPGPATVDARVTEGAPFAMSARLAVDNGAASAERVAIAPGRTRSASVTVTGDNGIATIRLTDVSGVPPDDCGAGGACFRGIETAAGDSILIFEGPRVVGAIHDQALESIGDSVAFDLNEVFSADSDTTLLFAVTSSDPTIVAVSLEGSVVKVTATGDEGDATITVTATDDLGQEATLEFVVTIGLPRGGLPAWLLRIIAEEAKATGQEENETEP